MFKKIIAMGLISIMGIMLFSGCNGSKLVEENQDLVELINWDNATSYSPQGIRTTYNNPDVMYEISADRGAFCVSSYAVFFQKTTLRREETIRWTRVDDEDITLAYIDVIVRVENDIIGYAVIKITSPDGSAFSHNAEIIKSVIFPKVNGEYQKVTQKQVEKKIKVTKK